MSSAQSRDLASLGSLSVVVSVFNSKNTIPALVDRARGALEDLGRPWEILLVNDGSRDGSWESIVDLAGRDSRIRGLDFWRNYGQHNAVLCGIRAARHDVIVTLDDDLQNPPEEIGSLLAELGRGFDVVYGTPQAEQHGLVRDLASRITKIVMQQSLGIDVGTKLSSFRAFRASLRKVFEGYQGPFVSIDVLLSWSTANFGSVVVAHDERTSGRSNYTLGKLVAHGINVITGFSTTPLRLASWTGFCFTLFGLGVLAYVVVRHLIEGESVPGFPFLASIIAIFSGAQLFAFGIMGEYLARIHVRLLDRPPYAIRRSTDASGVPPASPTGELGVL